MEVFIKTRKKKYRRSDDKIVTKEGKVLKYLRESRKLSVRKVGTIINRSDTWVSHAENGRMDLDPKKILKLLNVHGYNYDEFIGLVNNKKPLPENLYGECLEILKRLDKSKLKTVKSILESF